jgi:hypothetical protein
MGILVYGSGQVEVEIEDRALAHLQAVIGAKLRRNESFYFNWTTNEPEDRRHTVWLNPSIPIRYQYSEMDRPDINRDWLETLTVTANSPAGLTLIAEPARGNAGA